MAKTRKTFRAVAFIVALVMVACIAPTVAFAENSVTITDPTVSYATGEAVITTTGTINPGATITMLAVRSASPLTSLTGISDADLENSLMYIDQYKTDATSQGTKEWSFAIRTSASATGDYVTVFMGGTDAAMVSKSVSLVQTTTATDFAFAAESFTVGTPVEITFTDDSAWRTAITGVTVNGTAVTGLDTNTAGKISFTLAKGTYTDAAVVISASNYNDVSFTDTTAVVNKPAGTATLANYPEGKTAFVAGVDTIGLTLADSTTAGWLANVAVSVVDAENAAAGSYANGVITLTTAPTTAATYTVKFAATDYEAVNDITFMAIAPTAVVTPTAVTTSSDDDNFYVTIPADYTDETTGAAVAYTATLDGVAFTDYTGGTVATIAKAEYGTTPLKHITVIATATKEGFDSVTYTVLDADIDNAAEAAPSITAADVTLVGTTAVYGIAGAKVVTIALAATVIDPATQVVKVGDYQLYYAPERTAGGLHRFVGILRTNNADAATVAANASIETGTQAKIYYGKVQNPASTANLIQLDTLTANRIYKLSGVYSETYKDSQYLSTDVTGAGRIIPLHLTKIMSLYKNLGTKSSLFTVLAK